jgi:hypothetical protein
MKKLYCIALILLLTAALVSPVLAGKPSREGTCTVDVRSKPVALIANHLFIVYTNATGSYYYRGGPSDDGISGWGTIVTDSGLYLPGTIDYVRRAPSVTAAEGTAACAGACFDNTAERIEAGNIAYGVFTPNSNSVIRTLLHACSIREVKPNVWAPGWETVIPFP